jgi:septum site-determining protein MinD
MTPKRTVINVVSGKGGTGKTLLSCVLADSLGNLPDAETIVVDLDVFVRGLTSLLYYHRAERLRIADAEKLCVADLFVRKLKSRDSIAGNLAIAKYRSFDVMPAVSTINQVLEYDDIVPNNHREARDIVQNLLASIPEAYRFIILDSRAGYDELISATHELSDVSICVEEQDPISRITSDNLIAQLGTSSKTPLFRLVNKARGITALEQLEESPRGVTDLGVIPFDMDVLNSFGASNFWEEISRTLYRSALIHAWNRLSAKLDLRVDLPTNRISPVGSDWLESKAGMLSWRDRVYLIYGSFLAIAGLGYGLYGEQIIHIIRGEPLRAMSLFMGGVGLISTLLVFLRIFRK